MGVANLLSFSIIKDMKNIIEIANPCLHCPNARCKAFCPCGNQIPDILDAVKKNDLDLAAKLLYATNPFPMLTSLLCDHQRQCRGHCVRGIRGEAVDFPCVEYTLSQRFAFPYKPGEPNGKKVAVVGAGPSGLSAATFLLEQGFSVEVFEKESGLGGAILSGIPNFRFDKSCLKQIEDNLRALGAAFHFETVVDKAMMTKLKGDFDYVLVGVGAEKENRLNVPECSGIYSALSLLADANLKNDSNGLEKKKHVIVMGGGNVAMDISRYCARLGVKTTLIYRRDEASMPAQVHEIQEAKEDGVIFSTLTNVSSYKINDDQKALEGLRLVHMELGEKDESGRPSFHTIEGSEFDVECDAFIMAIGEKSDVASLVGEDEISDRLLLIGDCSYGAKNIAAAIKSGREAAQKIIEANR